MWIYYAYVAERLCGIRTRIPFEKLDFRLPDTSNNGKLSSFRRVKGLRLMP